MLHLLNPWNRNAHQIKFQIKSKLDKSKFQKMKHSLRCPPCITASPSARACLSPLSGPCSTAPSTWASQLRISQVMRCCNHAVMTFRFVQSLSLSLSLSPSTCCDGKPAGFASHAFTNTLHQSYIYLEHLSDAFCFEWLNTNTPKRSTCTTLPSTWVSPS